MLTNLQKQTAQTIINIFETGSVVSDYTNVTVVPDDPRGLTYGRSQTTLMTAKLFVLIKDYCKAKDAKLATQLRPYLERIEAKDTSLNSNMILGSLLREAGQDPVMQTLQDNLFDRVYWNPRVKLATDMGIQTALGITVVYDSFFHGSWKLICDRTIDQFGTVTDIGEKAWINHYVDIRRKWLATHSIELLRTAVYRMDVFKRLISAENWELALPLTVDTILIDEETLMRSGRSFRDSTKTASLLQWSLSFMSDKNLCKIQNVLGTAELNSGEYFSN